MANSPPAPVPPGSRNPTVYGAFVSYAREDAAVVEFLRAQLRERGQQLWLDVEGIVGGEDWHARIMRAIEACTAFVVVVSPDWANSKVCAAELDHALALHKLVVVLVSRDIDALTPALAGRTTIALRPSDAPERHIDEIEQALRRDLPWRERHTRLATRAREWIDGERDPAYLLVGADLRRAEAWLGTRGGRGELPTALQRELVAHSRQAAGRRQRRWMGAALVALAITAALAVVAISLRSGAIRDNHVALSRALAAQALLLGDRDPGLAATLSLEAQRVHDTPQARDALTAVLPRLGELLADMRGHTDLVSSLAMSGDGELLASGSVDGTVRLWDPSTRAAIGGPLRGHRGTIWSVAFASDGRTLATSGADGTVRLWDIASRRALGAPLRIDGKAVQHVTFSPDAKTVAAAGDGGLVRLWGVASRRIVATLVATAGGSVARWVAFSPDGRLIATAGGRRDGKLRIWNAATKAPVGAPVDTHHVSVHTVAFSPDGRLVASAGADGVVRMWDVATHQPAGAPMRLGVGSARGISTVTFSPDGRTLATTGSGVRLWDVTTRQPRGPVLALATLASTALAGGVVTAPALFSPDGNTLASANTGVQLWNVARDPAAAPTVRSFTLISQRRAGSSESVVTPGTVAYSPDGRTVAIADRAGGLGLWDVATRGREGRQIAPGRDDRLLAASFSPDGRMIATAGEDGDVRLWSARIRRPLARLRAPAGSALAIAFSPRGDRLAAAGDDGVLRLWSVTRRALLGRPRRVGRPGVPSLAFSADGRTVVVGTNEAIVLWDAIGRRVAARIAVQGSKANAVAFDREGRRIAAGGSDGSLRIWNAATRQPLAAAVDAHAGSVQAVAFSRDGRTLASAGADATWTWAWRAAGRRTRLGGSASAIAFSPDGTSLATVSVLSARLFDSVLWTADARARRARACRAGRRNLSHREWARFLPGEPYRETCP